MRRIPDKLLRCPDVLHHIWQARLFADSAGMLEELDTQLRVLRIRVKVLHTVNAELLARRRSTDEVEFSQLF